MSGSASGMLDSMFTTTGTDASGRSTGKKPVLVVVLLGNAREIPESIANTGAKFCEF